MLTGIALGVFILAEIAILYISTRLVKHLLKRQALELECKTI